MERYIVSIDQSTSASKVFLMDSRGKLARRFSVRHKQYYPKPGWAEHDADEIWHNVSRGLREVTEGLDPRRLAAVSVTNQRETTVFWDRATGAPVRPAIVWQDVRGSQLCAELAQNSDIVRKRTGLSLSPYYSAAKAAYALRADASLRARAESGDICIGTVDSFLIHRLTGGRRFATDMSNASRTQLFSLDSLAWDNSLCRIFGIPVCSLADILPSDGDFGFTDCECLPNGIPVTGVLGDSHASLFGHGCTETGMTKTSYGTGSSVMMNVGDRPVSPRDGLSCSVGYCCGGRACYVLEGNITCSGDTLNWLCEQAELCSSAAEVESVSASVPDTGGVYLVPAFSGLGAPYFDSGARAAIIGMNRATTRAHIVRAALESMAYQNADVAEVMAENAGSRLTALHADGGGSRNGLLMQFQADLLGCDVLCASCEELSAVGAGLMAGLATGFITDASACLATDREYRARISPDERSDRMAGWRAAVARCR